MRLKILFLEIGFCHIRNCIFCMNKFRYIFLVVCLRVVGGAWAEEKRPAALGGVPEYLGYTQVYDFIEELADMKIISVNSVVKPYDRNQIAAWLMEASKVDTLLSVRQRKELIFYLNDFALECEGMYDGAVQWSNVGAVVNKKLWKEFFELRIENGELRITDISHGIFSPKAQRPLVHGEHGILSPTDDTDLKDFLPSGFNDSLSCFARSRSTDSTDSLFPKFSLSLFQPAFHYADEWFECKFNPIIGMDLTMNGHGMVMHRWWGAEIRADIVDHVAVWGSIRDHSYSGDHLNDEYYASVGQGISNGARLSQPGYLNNLPGAYYHYMRYGGDYAEVRGGIKAYAWWGSIGLVKDNIQWGDSYHSSNIISNRAPSFPMIELKLKPANWFRLDYIHGFLASGVVDSTYYRVEENPIDGSSHRMYRTAAKYLAANMLTFVPVKGLDLSIGSAVVYGARNMSAAFSIPITFFNSMDFQMNSGAMLDNENSQIFFNISSRNLKYTHFYGSVYIDEINWSRLKPSNPEHNFFSWKVGARVSNWPLRDLSLTAEFTRTNCGNYQHPYQVLTWASNGYNLGHYLGDNAQEVYVALAYKPIRSLSFTLSYVNATKYNEYLYTRTPGSTFIKQKQFAEKVWRNDEVKLHAVYEVVNNAYAFVDLGWNNARGFEVASELTMDEVRLTAEGYLRRYTPAFYWGENVTVKIGFSFYY